MKLPRLITLRRLKWAGLVASICVAAVMVASYWYWPSYSWARAKSWAAWGVNIEPCGISVDRTGIRTPGGFVFIPSSVFANGWRFRSRQPMPSHAEITAGASIQMPPKTVWLPTYDSYYGQGSYVQQRVKIPFWIPLLLLAAPTAWLWHTDRRAKPWQCPTCRYDLRGLDGAVCPECGTPTQRKP